MRYAVIIYTDTTSSEAVADYMQYRRRRRQQEQWRQQRRWYFFKQRLSGIVLLALTILAVMWLDGDATIAVFTVPLGLYMLFGKEMLITNEFYWQTKERKAQCRKRYRY